MVVELPLIAPPLIIEAPIIFFAFGSSLLLFLTTFIPIMLIKSSFIGLRLVGKIAVKVFENLNIFLIFTRTIFLGLVRGVFKLIQTLRILFLIPFLMLLITIPPLILFGLNTVHSVSGLTLGRAILFLLFNAVWLNLIRLLLTLIFFVKIGFILIRSVIVINFSILAAIMIIKKSCVGVAIARNNVALVFEQLKTVFRFVLTISLLPVQAVFKLVQAFRFLFLVLFLVLLITIPRLILFAVSTVRFVSLLTIGRGILFLLLNVLWLNLISLLLTLFFFVKIGLILIRSLTVILPLSILAAIIITRASCVSLTLLGKIPAVLFEQFKTVFRFVFTIFLFPLQAVFKLVQSFRFLFLISFLMFLIIMPPLILFAVRSVRFVSLLTLGGGILFLLFNLVWINLIRLLLTLFFFVKRGLILIRSLIVILPLSILAGIMISRGSCVGLTLLSKISALVFKQLKIVLRFVLTIFFLPVLSVLKLVERLGSLVFIPIIIPLIAISPLILLAFAPALFVSLFVSQGAILFSFVNVVWYKFTSKIFATIRSTITNVLRAGVQIVFVPIRSVLAVVGSVLETILPTGPFILLVLLPLFDAIYGFVLGPVVDLLVTLLGPLNESFLPIEPILIFSLAFLGLLLSPLSPITFVLSPVILPIFLIIVLVLGPLLLPLNVLLKPLVLLANTALAPLLRVAIKLFIPGVKFVVKFFLPGLYLISKFVGTVIFKIAPLVLSVTFPAGGLLLIVFRLLKLLIP